MGLIKTITDASRFISELPIGIFIAELPNIVLILICIGLISSGTLSVIKFRSLYHDGYYVANYISFAITISMLVLVFYPFLTSKAFPVMVFGAIIASCLSIIVAVAFDNLLRVYDTTSMVENERTPEAFMRRTVFLYTACGFAAGSILMLFRWLCPFHLHL